MTLGLILNFLVVIGRTVTYRPRIICPNIRTCLQRPLEYLTPHSNVHKQNLTHYNTQRRTFFKMAAKRSNLDLTNDLDS